MHLLGLTTGIITSSESLLVDLVETIQILFDDIGSINQLVSIKSIQALLPEGFCLYYKGYLLVNSLEPRHLSKVS